MREIVIKAVNSEGWNPFHRLLSERGGGVTFQKEAFLLGIVNKISHYLGSDGTLGVLDNRWGSHLTV